VNIKDTVTRQYMRILFEPGIASLIANPFYLIRKELYRAIRQFAPLLSGRVMDFGCGSKPYAKLFIGATEYIGVDVESTGHNHRNSDVDVYYRDNSLPFPNEYFDGVFSSEVFEHIFNLEEILCELARVVRPGGKLLITVPFLWGEHEVPYDFARYSSFGISYLLRKHGFKIIEQKKSLGYFLSCVQIFTVYLHLHVFPRNRFLRILLGAIIIFPIHCVALFLNLVFPYRDDLYMNNIVLAERTAKAPVAVMSDEMTSSL
jgi:SAM-dependent methyltransferase